MNAKTKRRALIAMKNAVRWKKEPKGRKILMTILKTNLAKKMIFNI